MPGIQTTRAREFSLALAIPRLPCPYFPLSQRSNQSNALAPLNS